MSSSSEREWFNKYFETEKQLLPDSDPILLSTLLSSFQTIIKDSFSHLITNMIFLKIAQFYQNAKNESRQLILYVKVSKNEVKMKLFLVF